MVGTLHFSKTSPSLSWLQNSTIEIACENPQLSKMYPSSAKMQRLFNFKELDIIKRKEIKIQ